MWRHGQQRNKEFLSGSVRFEVQDADTALLNKLRKFNLRNIKSLSANKIDFSVALVHKREVCRLLGKRTYTVFENKNIFSVMNFFYTRSRLVAAALIFIAVFITLDQFLFRIKIEGVKGQELARVNAYLDENGVTRFSHKSKKRAEVAARNLVTQFDFIAAANAQVKGSGVVFRIHRAENISREIQGDIISTHDGVITRIIVLSGTSLVTVGDVVLKGDTLVYGARASAIIYIHNGPKLVCIINNTGVKSDI